MPGGRLSERELLRACQAHDASAAVALVRRYEPLLLRVVLRLVRRLSVAEEIVQEAFLRTLRDIERIDPERGVGPWLMRSAINLARSHLRRASHAESSEPAHWSTALNETSPEGDPEEALATGQLRRQVEAALDLLPSKLREVVLLHYSEGFSFAELAPMLGVPSATLRMRALRARARLRDALKGVVW